MAQPWYYAEGTGQRFSDTRLRVWTKILGAIQSQAGSDSTNDPKPEDTLRRIKQKINKALL